MDKRKILIVDDEKDLVETVVFQLEQSGYEVISAYDGPEGLEKAKKEKPDLIILDIMMPKMSGDDVARVLKDDEETRDIPILFLTCLAKGVGDMQKPYMSGGNIFLAKPFDVEELLKAIEEILKKR